MRMRPLLSAAAIVAIGATVIGAPVTMAGGSTTRMVDDDGHASVGDCGGGATAHDTIQAAIDDASSGDTVLVCPGTYVGNVVVTDIDDLTLRSTRSGAATIQAPESVGAPGIVSIYGANGITFQGFRVITRTGAGCSTAEVGIFAVGARDVTIRGNTVRGFGDTTSECGLLVGIMAGYPYGGGTSAADLAGGPPEDLTTTGLIAYNSVRDHLFIGIAAMSSPGDTVHGATRVDIRNNSIRYYHLGQDPADCETIPIASASQRRSLRSAIAGIAPAGPGSVCFGIGIYQGSGTPDSTIPGASGVIAGNRISSGPDATSDFVADAAETPAQLFGILVVDPKHTPGASDVRDNLVFRNVFGITAVDATGASIRGNRTRDSFFGISLWDTVAASVRNNRTLDNVVGIFVADEPFDSSSAPYYESSDNVVRGNDANGNYGDSCYDETLGSGTEGTANTWTDNDAEVNSSGPDGICGPKEL